MNMSRENYPQPGYGQVPYDERCDAPTPAMDPYTTQILNRITESEKYLAEVTIQLSRIADKLVGAYPEAATKELLSKSPSLGAGIMEQIVSRSNILNRKIGDLGNIVNRLQSL
jgi:hypothetical protein